VVNWDKIWTRILGIVFILISIATVFYGVMDFVYYLYINWFAFILPVILVPMGLWMLRTGGDE